MLFFRDLKSRFGIYGFGEVNGDFFAVIFFSFSPPNIRRVLCHSAV